MKHTWAIVVAGGKGNRFGGKLPKQFLNLGGKPVLQYSLDLFQSIPDLGGLVLVLPEEFIPEWRERLSGNGVQVVAGGETRQQSVSRGLAAVDAKAKHVLVHDAARPLATLEIIHATLQGAKESGAAVAAVPVADTMKEGDQGGQVRRTVARDGLFRVQTPQGFERDLLQECLTWARKEGLDATDEATLVEKMGRPVKLVAGSELNFKVTTATDFALAEAILKQDQKGSEVGQIRIGEGYDVHTWAEERPLILGGVKIPFEMGLQGHSDADALTHAVGDALLGAVAGGDLGQHFPDTDPKWKGVSSLDLLAIIREVVKKKGFQVNNVDATLICQKPKLAPHLPAMRENIARVLKVSTDQVSIKATTEEGLGFTGQMEGLAARAVALVGKKP